MIKSFIFMQLNIKWKLHMQGRGRGVARRDPDRTLILVVFFIKWKHPSAAQNLNTWEGAGGGRQKGGGGGKGKDHRPLSILRLFEHSIPKKSNHS